MLHAGTLLGGEVQTRACSHPPRPKKARKYGAIWYTGTNDLERVEKKANELILWLEQNSLWPPEPRYRIAQYDTPSTLRFFKRNELQYPLIEFHS